MGGERGVELESEGKGRVRHQSSKFKLIGLTSLITLQIKLKDLQVSKPSLH